jgi:hypothetical protein
VGNILSEAGDIEDRNLLYVYRSDADDHDELCARAPPSLVSKASVVIVALHANGPGCVAHLDRELGPKAVFFGSKEFGYNVNPFGRVPMNERRKVYSQVPVREVTDDREALNRLGPRYIDLLAVLGDGSRVRFYDDGGNPLTPDRLHLTRYGAVFLAERLKGRLAKELAGPGRKRLI